MIEISCPECGSPMMLTPERLAFCQCVNPKCAKRYDKCDLNENYQIEDLGVFTFMFDFGRLWIHKKDMGRDDLVVDIDELLPLAKKLRQIFKQFEKLVKEEG